ncbi:AB hydrolase superfamily protein, partial [Neolecta irregularis DAH-3]
MGFNTATIAAHTTGTVFKTFFVHYLNQNALKDKPSKQLSYHEGFALISKFLEYASHHTVEEIQSFTSMHVPASPRVLVQNVDVPEEIIENAGDILATNLGPEGLERVGGRRWWMYRRKKLQIQIVEPKEVVGTKNLLMYVHGGAYYFGSTDEHRYQIQRHARKCNSRAYAPRYRLAPQYPFPCGLLDILACYLHLLTISSPSRILLSGDSAGGSLILATLCILRDSSIPLPSGASLISPWVDLTHSFPSILDKDTDDYIPAHGFIHKPSITWPPPTIEDLEAVQNESLKAEETSVQEAKSGQVKPVERIRIELDGTMVEIKEQIQLYASNELLDFPLVSPVLQASLGGLCPLFIVGRKGFATKSYSDDCLSPLKRRELERYPPTQVYLQVYDSCCHVTPALSFTKPAKYMYRAVANFHIWALNESRFTSSSSIKHISKNPKGIISDFTKSIIRERVDINGNIRAMECTSEIPCLNIDKNIIGVVKPGPIRLWLDGKSKWDKKYHSVKSQVQTLRAKSYAQAKKNGFLGGMFGDERPPLSSIAALQDPEEIRIVGTKNLLMYVHGGAYYFGSYISLLGTIADPRTDEHRYQIQRHARKCNS